jgi:molybdopterin adenylyltransferase
MEIRVGILTISDRSSRGERVDLSGPALVGVVTDQAWKVILSAVVPDESLEISRLLAAWADRGDIDIILTTGGTGFGLRDVTPEATLDILDRLAPGLSEAMRAASLRITPHAMLSRAAAGIRKQTLIVNLPGSPKGAIENLQVILPAIPHAVELLRNDPRSEQGHLPSS